MGNPGPSGFSGLFRNSDGAWVRSFFGSLDLSDNIHAELHAFWHGLTISWDAGYRNLIIQSDCLKAIRLVTNELPAFHKYINLILNIRELLARDWSAKISHTLREGNACADLLAKKGAS